MKRGERDFPGEQNRETPVKYTVPFDWGALKVTEAADAVYGLVPLTAEKQSGDYPHEASPPERFPRVDFKILAPDEMVFADDIEEGMTASRTNVSFSRRGVSLSSAIKATPESLYEEAVGLMASTHEMEEDEVEQLTDDQEIPFGERLERDIPQVIAHAFVVEAMVGGSAGVEKWMDSAFFRKLYKDVRTLGGLAIFNGAAVEGLGYLIEGHATAGTEIIAGGYTTGILLMANKLLRKGLITAEMIRDSRRLIAQHYASEIAADIHATFCTRHFDHMAEQMFGDTPQLDS